MSTIQSQVNRARRRILVGLFGRALCVTLFVSLVVATLAIGAAAIWAIETPFRTWSTYWLAGASVAGVLAAMGYAIVKLPPPAAVAGELDRRFGLRERVSSVMLLGKDQQSSPFGEALVSDAERRASQLAIADKFALRPNKWGWLPVSIVPVLTLILLFAEPARPTIASSTKSVDSVETEQVKTATEQLKRRIQAQRRKAEIEGLDDAEDMFRKLEADLDKVAEKKNLNRKDAMIAMNDLKKELEKRRDELGSPEQVQRALAQMKGLESGPADQVAKSMEKGDFGKAKELIQDLAKKLKDGKLSQEEKAQLKKQIEQMQQQMQQAAEQHEQKKQDLQKQIDQAKQEGRGDDAAKLQTQLDGLEAQNGQMQKMQQMAESMKKAAEAMESGDAQQAGEALEEMSDQLQEMQQEMSEMEELQQAMDSLSQGKNQMRCKSCGGLGCEKCRGNQDGGKGGNEWGRGKGSGTGPETDLDSNTYDTQVRGDLQKGEVITSGTAEGPNRKGATQQEIQQAVENVLSNESDPLESQTLPRDEREHAEQYFNRLRDGT